LSRSSMSNSRTLPLPSHMAQARSWPKSLYNGGRRQSSP
jgi:hypothetical protein